MRRHRDVRRAWQTVLAFVAGVLIAPIAIVVTSSQAHACSCAMGETADQVEWADRIFTGKVSSVVDGDSQGFRAQGWEFTVAVDEVFKGAVEPEVTLVSAGNSAACGYDSLPGGDEKWVFFAYKSEGRRGGWGINICGGSGPAVDQDLAAIATLTDQRAAPEPGEPARGSEQADAGDGGARGAANAEEGDAVPWGVGGLLVVLGFAAAGALVVRRRA